MVEAAGDFIGNEISLKIIRKSKNSVMATRMEEFDDTAKNSIQITKER